MKKISMFTKLIVAGLLCFGLIASPIEARAAEEVAVTSTVTHVHTGNGGACTTPRYHSHSGNASSGGGCYGGRNYHVHSGSAAGGGCYTSPVYHSHTSSCNGTCGHQMIMTQTVPGATSTYSYKCNACGATSGGTSATPPKCSATVRKCGKSTSTIVSYNIGCGKTTSTVESYYMNCGKNNYTIDGYSVTCTSAGASVLGLSIKKTVTDENYVLTAEAVPTGNGFATVTGYKWNTGETTAIKEVTINGTYICTISYNDRGVARTATISYAAMDYDTEAPVITNISADVTAPTKSDVVITVEATDNKGEISYSINNVDWQADNTFSIHQNGTYTIHVKDPSGNISASDDFTITNIDKTNPVVTIDTCPTDWTKENFDISFSATDNFAAENDILYAVSENASLTEGQITGINKTYTITENGTYYVYAKDTAGNIDSKQIVITCIDREAPVITVNPYSNDWQNVDLDITFSATDNSNDTIYYAVAQTSSMPASAINGTNTTFTASANGTYYIHAKDLAGNIAVKEFNVRGIDKTPPVVTMVEELPSKYTRVAYNVEFSVTDDSNDTVSYSWVKAPGTQSNAYTQTEPFLTVSANGTYYFYATDLAGNTTTYPVIISNFDYVAPTADVRLVPHNTYTVNGTEWIDKVDVTVVATDDKRLHSEAYSYDGAEYVASSVMTYTQNGNFYVTVRDEAGNTKKVNFTLDNLDDQKPTITKVIFSYKDENNVSQTVENDRDIPEVRYITINVEATDEETGLSNNAYRYSFNGGEFTEWQADASFRDIYLNGTYVIEVRDNSENIATKTITINTLSEMFDVTFIDVDSETGEVIAEQVFEKKLGTTVAGSEIGNDVTLNAYHTGYEYVNCDTSTVATEDTVVHRYFKMRCYTVTFYNEYGVVVKEEKVPYGGSTEAPAGPPKENIEDSYNIITYDFGGWVDKNDKAAVLTNITANKEYYPVYTKEVTPLTYKVTFYVDGVAISEQEVVAGEDAVAPEEPVKTGYTFTSWDKNFTNICGHLSVNAVFAYAPVTTITTTPVIETVIAPVYIPTDSEIEQLANTEVVFLESKIQKKPVLDPIPENKEIDISELLKRKQIYDKETPLAAFAGSLIDFYTSEETRTFAITATAAAGFIATYALTSTALTLIGGFSLTQLFIFLFILFGKKTRCVKGAWMTDEETTKYVDKYGRKINVEIVNGRYVFKRGKKVLYGVDVNSLLEKLNANKISYKEFEELIAESEVYTAFSKDLEIETWNLKEINGANTKKSKAKGFNLTKGIKNALDSAGNYAIRLTQNGKQALFEMKYAMENI